MDSFTNQTQGALEEGIEKYRVGRFHPVRVGELYDSKYKVLRKLGYGQYSTVWLVRNEQYVTLINIVHSI